MTAKGAKVVWIRGAIGLTGVCTGEIEVPAGDFLLKIQTDKGCYMEHPANLEERQALSALWSYNWCSREAWQQQAPKEGPIDSETYAIATAYRKGD
jgi:hypothetical protein